MLKFSKANAKIQALNKVEALKPYLNGRKVYSFDLLSGWSCPFAEDCLSKVHEINRVRKVIDGPNISFRCFSASQEALFTAVYKARRHNYEQVKNRKAAVNALVLLDYLPKDSGIIRIHVGGDFFNQAYFDAWLAVARMRPNVLFYAYTKSLPYWVNRINEIPDNLILTASYGGRCDAMISQYNLRHVKVIENESAANGGYIDHDDSCAANPDIKHRNFYLLIHGIQPAESSAAKAIVKLNGKGSYSRKKQ